MSGDASPASEPPDRVESLVLHPIFIGSLLLWAVNDHLLKGAAPGWLTGKLSDVAALIGAPILLAAIGARLARRPELFRAMLIVAATATAATMVSINLWEPAARAYCVGLGLLQWPLVAARDLLHSGSLPPVHEVWLTRDPTDAFTAVVAPVSPWLCGQLSKERPPSTRPRSLPAPPASSYGRGG